MAHGLFFDILCIEALSNLESSAPVLTGTESQSPGFAGQDVGTM